MKQADGIADSGDLTGARAADGIDVLLDEARSSNLPMALARVLREAGDGSEYPNHVLSRTIDHLVGEYVRALLPDLHRLHRWLVHNGRSAEAPFDLEYSDRRAFYLLDAPAKKVFAFAGRGFNFLVCLAQDPIAKEWLVHIRRYWDKMEEADPGFAERLANGEFDLADFHRLASSGLQFSDDTARWALPPSALPRPPMARHGASCVERPGLAAYLISEFEVGAPGACPGLRFGDQRDRGYVLSMERHRDGEGTAVGEALHHVRDTEFCLGDLRSAIAVLDELDADVG